MTHQASKPCAVCGREIQWRKKWARDWENVRYCSQACRRDKLGTFDRALEAAILQRLQAEKRRAAIDLAEVMQTVRGVDEAEHKLRERLRRAVRRLVAQGIVEIMQNGRVANPSRVTGAFRIRLTRTGASNMATRNTAHFSAGYKFLPDLPDRIMTDKSYMDFAIKEARKGDAPYGAVLVKEGEVTFKAYNTVASDGDVTAHAEINVLRKALADGPIDSLEGYTLYTTGEPCAMCTGAIIFAGIERVVYAASVEELAAVGQDQIHISSATIIAAGFQNIEVEGGVQAAEVLRLFEK